MIRSPAERAPSVGAGAGPAPGILRVPAMLRRGPLGRSGLLAIAAGFALLVMAAGSGVWLAIEGQQTSRLVAHTLLVQSDVSNVLVTLQAAETGQRGFLLTGEESYLAPFVRARDSLPEQLAELATGTADNPRHQGRLQRLDRLIRNKLSEMQATADLRRSQGLAPTAAVVRTDRSEVLMEEIRSLIDAMKSEEDRLLDDRADEYEEKARWLIVVLVLGFTLVLGLGGLSVANVYRNTRALEQARGVLLGANETLEQAVAARTRALSDANEEIQRFAYIVSHDLRAPLVNIMGFTSELEAAIASIDRHLTRPGEAVALPEAVKQALEVDFPESIQFIRTSSAKMDRLIGAILRLSREGRRVFAPEPVDVGALVATIVDSLRQQAAEKGAEITVSSLPGIVSDRLALEQVFGNLIENALKYLSPKRPGRIRITGRLAGGRAYFDVVDNGRGIQPKDHERVFELFRRAGTQDTPGEGIGLAHVRALTRRLGGDVTCQSGLDAGSTFTVNLPTVLSQQETDPHADEPTRADRSDRRR